MNNPADIEVWSRDEEQFYDLGDFLDMALDDLEPGHVVYRGIQVMRDAAYFVRRPSDLLAEEMQERAWDEADEFAEDWPNLPDAKWAELDALVTDWLNKNVPVTFWTVRDVKPVTVTEALLAEWREPAAGVDACATCGGARGGVPGNENLVDGKPMCDYCHSDLIRTHGVKESARWCGACDTYRAMCDCDTSGVAGTSGNQSKGPK